MIKKAINNSTAVFFSEIGNLAKNFQLKDFLDIALINWEKLLNNGLPRLVGKDYIVQDGDVIEFKI